MPRGTSPNILEKYVVLKLLHNHQGPPLTRYSLMKRFFKSGLKGSIPTFYRIINTLIKIGDLVPIKGTSYYTLSSQGIKELIALENKIRFILETKITV